MNITEEAIEAAAKALAGNPHGEEWKWHTGDVMTVLEAIAPFLPGTLHIAGASDDG